LSNVIHRWETKGTYTKRDRIGRLSELTSRDYRQLLRVVERDLTIGYSALYREANLWDSNASRSTVARATIQ
ncbi:hypothetical protein J3E71DRAFT_187219, partial [Bipolaris maydis]